MNEQQRDAFELLLLDWEDDALTDQQQETLRAILRDHPEARERFVQLQMLRAAMHLDANSGINPTTLVGHDDLHVGTHDSARSDRPETGRTTADDSVIDASMSVNPAADATISRSFQRRSIFRSGLTVAASLMVIVLAGRWALLESRQNDQTIQQPSPTADPGFAGSRRSATAQEPMAHGVALVTRLVDAEFAENDSLLTAGQALSPGMVSISSGLAQIEFFCGATVVLQGPSRFELQSATEARLHEGTLRANVPPAARGFLVHVDEMKVVDLGTEFAIAASEQGADIQVFDGKVELHRGTEDTQSDAPQLITAGNALVRRSDGRLGSGALTPERFVGVADLDSRVRDRTQDRYQRWLEYSQTLRRDPRLITYYAMDRMTSWNRKLTSSRQPHQPDLDGAIVGARRTTGRWPQKPALEFKRPGDRVRVDIPGEFDSLTFACWVKIDSLDRWYNSLFLTDNYQRGEPHWQILDSGQLFFSVRVSEGDAGPEHREVLSPPFWEPSMSGQWLHLATTYDVEQKQTTHYLNGRVLSVESIPDIQLVTPTRIGKASIGNWSLPTKPDAKFAIRNLNGSIDEFMLFAAALSDDEIMDLYEHGKP